MKWSEVEKVACGGMWIGVGATWIVGVVGGR